MQSNLDPIALVTAPLLAVFHSSRERVHSEIGNSGAALTKMAQVN